MTIKKSTLLTRKYRLTEKGKKSYRITDWKRRGVIAEDYNALHEEWLKQTNCELCNVELTTGKSCATRKCLDHNHKTGKFRNILCNYCNITRKD